MDIAVFPGSLTQDGEKRKNTEVKPIKCFSNNNPQATKNEVGIC